MTSNEAPMGILSAGKGYWKTERPETLADAIAMAQREGLRNPAPIARWIIKKFSLGLSPYNAWAEDVLRIEETLTAAITDCLASVQPRRRRVVTHTFDPMTPSRPFNGPFPSTTEQDAV